MDVKQRLREAVEWPVRHPEKLARMGVASGRGVLMYGPPGCSKTLLARATATEAGLNFFAVQVRVGVRRHRRGLGCCTAPKPDSLAPLWSLRFITHGYYYAARLNIPNPFQG